MVHDIPYMLSRLSCVETETGRSDNILKCTEKLLFKGVVLPEYLLPIDFADNLYLDKIGQNNNGLKSENTSSPKSHKSFF